MPLVQPDTAPTVPATLGADVDPHADLPMLVLREPLTEVVSDTEALAATVVALAAGQGPIAVDTERASGFRYSQRAYLLQLRRSGSGTHLVDPIACPDLAALARVMAGQEWILHAASQDLPCLAELGLVPEVIFDTELAGRLLNLPRVGLAHMSAELLGQRMAKSHSAEDWSVRPLPTSWLHYAALDVEPLAELRAVLGERLDRAGKAQWAREEFAAVLDPRRVPEPQPDRWRRTSSIHKVRSRRGLAIVAELWAAREGIAADTDVAPGRILPDSALVAAALAQPRTEAALMEVPGFTGRGRTRHRRVWAAALRRAWETPEHHLPTHERVVAGPPPARAWRRRDPAAAERLEHLRHAVAGVAQRVDVPQENLLAPAAVRALAWDPPEPITPTTVAHSLVEQGARAWQVDLTANVLSGALGGAAPS